MEVKQDEQAQGKQYLLKIHYRNQLMDKVTGYLQEIIPEWGERNKRLVTTEAIRISGPRPLTPAEIDDIKERIRNNFEKNGYEIEGIELEEATDGSTKR